MRTKLIFSLLFFLYYPTVLAMQTLFIMGPSCAGKSTISHELKKNLGNQWILAEYDLIEEQMQEHVNHIAVFYQLIAHVNQQLNANKNVIVDTNFFYNPACKELVSSHNTYILIYAPLDILLKRNTTRLLKKNRTFESSLNAQKWVRQSYQNFFSAEQPVTYTYTIDTHRNTLEEIITETVPKIISVLS